MQKILQFKLSGKFAHFKFPFTSPNFLKKSFSILPRTTILGLMGSIIGLNGLQQYNDEVELPEYYGKLKHIPVAITINKIPLKRLIKYNSLNSFANNAKQDGGNIIIKEEILLNPEYIITLLLDDSINEDKEIMRYLNEENIKSKYHIYLGKNEFFANITNIKISLSDEFKIQEYNEIERLNSIIPINLLDTSIVYENLIYDSFSKNIDFSEKKLKTKLCEVGYFINEEKRNNIHFKKSIKLLNLNNNFYYFFEDEK